MFEQARLSGTSTRSIPLATSKGRDIANEVTAAPTLQSDRVWEDLKSRHGQLWKERKGPTGGYNCFGHVWASRRTGIFDDTEVSKIIEDDEYRDVAMDRACPGDLIIYQNADSGSFLHVARVLEIRDTGFKTPWVVSKFRDDLGEAFHAANVDPYRKLGIPVRIRCLTDRR